MNKTIVITGGHHNSALALAKLLQQREYRIMWLGHRYTMKGVKNISQEYIDVSKENIQFIELRSGKIHKGNPLEWFKTFFSWIYCLQLFAKERPAMVITFGGYLAVPPAFAASFLRIPVVAHEQTRVLGLANRVILPIAKQFYLAWPMAELASKKKVKVIGLPMDKRDIKIKSKAAVLAKLQAEGCQVFAQPNLPWLVVSGGKQGSHVVNMLIHDCLEDLLQEWNVFHQTGDNSQTKDLECLRQKRESLNETLKNRYCVAGYTHHFKDVLQVSDLVIGRSGAHTVYEVLLYRKKMLAIPLPFSYQKEQYKNAQLLEELGLGLVLEQDEISPKKFLNGIQTLHHQQVDLTKINQYVQTYMSENAGLNMADEIDRILGGSQL